MVLTVHGEGGYQVHIDRGLLHRAGPLLAPIARRWAVITDDTVAPLYGDVLCGSLAAAGLAAQVFTVPTGEGSKTLARYEALLRALAEAGFTRTDGVIALGGGVIGDLAGFVAATCLRGLPLVMAPTTLLAQADSAVGGKVGLDAPWGKNQIGAVYRPRLVLADTAALDTLPPSPTLLRHGGGHQIRHGLRWGDPRHVGKGIAPGGLAAPVSGRQDRPGGAG